jgi:hypothetical protein
VIDLRPGYDRVLKGPMGILACLVVVTSPPYLVTTKLLVTTPVSRGCNLPVRARVGVTRKAVPGGWAERRREASARATRVDRGGQERSKVHPWAPSKGNLSQSIIRSSFLYPDPFLFIRIRNGEREKTMFAKPRKTTIFTNGDVVATVIEFEASIKAVISTSRYRCASGSIPEAR